MSDIKITNVWLGIDKENRSLYLLTVDGQSKINHYCLEDDIDAKTANLYPICTYKSHLKSQFTCC